MEIYGCKINGIESEVYGLELSKTVSISAPERVTKLVQIPGRHGALDFSNSLTGYPVYKAREIELSLIPVDGRTPERMADFRSKVSAYIGQTVKLELPDISDYYWEGVLDISESEVWRIDYINVVLSNVYPFRRKKILCSKTETVSGQDITLYNRGDEPVIPVVSVTADTTVTIGGSSYTLSAGTYTDSAFLLKPRTEQTWTVSGSGTITVRWREGILA